MNHIIIALSLSFLVLSLASDAFADKCDDVMDYANKIYDSAITASRQSHYSEAVNLYKSAYRYYSKASKMKNCRCPKIKGAAKARMNRCKSYAAQHIEKLKVYENISHKTSQQQEKYGTGCGNKSLVSITLSDGSVEEYCE